LFDGVAEPDLDRGDVDRALIDEGAFVGAEEAKARKALSLLIARSAVLRFL
jgi:hypothetical protein